MPSKTDFNVSPYYDDFSQSKNFHRVMYRPGFAVQARELTTQQSILQNQIEKFGDHMFKNGSMVIPGNIHFNTSYRYIKLTSFTGTLANFKDTTVTGGTSGIKAKVLNTTANDGTNPDTLYVIYKDSGSDNIKAAFDDGETLTSDAGTGETAVVSEVGYGSICYVDAGVFYVNGYFVETEAQELILEQYTTVPSYRVGFTIGETFVTSTDDTSLLDNAQGSSNENATGAHRLKITLTLAALDLESTADSSFIELSRILLGQVVNQVSNSTYNIMGDELARRTFDESGDYTIRNFDLDVRENLIAENNRGIYSTDAITASGNTAAESLLALGLSQGKAYVRGYEVEKFGTTFIDLEKARDFDTDSGSVTRFEQLPFVNVTNIHGTPDIGFVSGETETFKKVRLVDEEHSTRGTVLVNNDGTVQDIGRAKSRGIEYSSGSASGVFMSTAALTSNTYKHYLFDTVMFAHLNVRGPASGALTTGETLTGGTSGATGIVESITSLGVATITGITQANPPVVTCSGGHNFKEGQIIQIASVSGMTNVNSGFFTVKNSSSTTFELFVEGAQAGINSAPLPVNGTGFAAYTSGGTASHTIVVLSDVKREFTEGETCTGGSSSNTAVVQNTTFGCKAFEQKEFAQTKGISMAGSPVYTADVDLTSTFGDVKTLTGTISTVDPDASSGSIVMDGSDANGTDADGSIILEDATETGSAVTAIGLENPSDQADRINGSGTKFLSELKIGDQITFEDDSNSTVTRIIQSIHSNTRLETAVGLGTTSATSKIFQRQRTKIQSPEHDTALFKMPYNVVKTLLTTDNSGVSDTSFKIRRQFVSTLSSSGTATLTAGTNEIFTSHTENDVTVSVMAKGGSATAGEVGDVITLSSSGDYTLGGSPTGKTLAIDLGSTFNGSKIKILATISASVVSAKTKTNTTGETVRINLTNSTISEATIALNLGKADVHKINSVFMAVDFSTEATTDDTDITDRFELDTGQRDNFYDVARLVRKVGKTAPTGRLLINFDYFEHGAGNFFSVDSYSGFAYGSIPSYTSDVTGEKFELRECLDFRPRVDNASTINAGDGQDRQYSGTGGSAIELPKINSDITADLEFYLAKKAKVFMTHDGNFKVAEGISEIDPDFPANIEDSMHLYNLTLPAFTFKTSDVKIEPVDNRRFTMRDIGRLQKRIENIEFYTQLSLLESEAQNMQIQDADGFDRFKNGIIVDNFTGHGIADVTDADYSVSMDMAEGELRPAFHQDNINLIEADSNLANSTAMTDAIRTTNGYQKTGDLITLPYTSESYKNQPYASGTANLNPYDIIPFVGVMTLSPDIDEWFDTEKQPELVVDLPGTYDAISDLANEKVLDLNVGTVWNNWNDTWAGSVKEVNRQVSTSGNTQTTTISTEQRVKQRRSGIRTALVPNVVKTQFGDRVTSINFIPFIREKTITFTAQGMKPNTRVHPFFDGIDVAVYVTPTGSSAGAALTTNANGEASGTFAIPDPNVASNPRWRTGKRIFRLTTNTINSLTGDIFTSAEADYTAKGLLQSVQGTVVSTREASIRRDNLAEDKEIKRSDSTSTSITIQQEQNNGSQNGGGGGSDNQNSDSTYQGEVFIGAEYIDGEKNPGRYKVEDGPNTTAYQSQSAGQGNPNGNSTPPTAQGGPSNDGQANGLNGTGPSFGCGWRDPLAQSFMVDTQNGIMITSLDIFFSSKSSTIPVTVQIVTMQNGYPTRTVVPFGQITVAASDINVSTDGATATTFTFPSPVFLQDSTEYAFVLLANTDEYTCYTATIGEKTLDGSRLISKQPYLGSMFASQNSSTWDAMQGEDIKFDIKCAQFTMDTTGIVYLVNDVVPAKTLKQNPITTTASSAVITVHHRNHGMHSTSANVTIAGLATGTYNGIASTNINGTYTTIGNIKLDSYTITAQNSDTATASGDIGGTTVTATRNIAFDVIQPVVGFIQPPDTTLVANLRTTGGRTLEGSETEYSLQTAAKEQSVIINQDKYMTAPGYVASAINETNEMSGSKSLVLALSLTTPIGGRNISPIIDTKRLSAHLIQNRINNPVDGTTPDFTEETTNTGGSSAAKYMTRPIILENSSTSLDIRISANIRSTSAIKMFYRASSADDVRKLGDVAWRAFNDDGTPDLAVTPTDDNFTFRENKFSVSSLPGFTAFQLKVVMTGTNSSYPPLLKDMRGIALAV